MDLGSESRWCWLAVKSESSGPAATEPTEAGVEGDATLPTATGDANCRTGDKSKPGGRDGVHSNESGARYSSSLRVSGLWTARSDVVICDGAAWPSSIRRKNGARSSLGEDGHTEVGEAGSGVDGGMRAALERRRRPPGEAERAQGLPRGRGGAAVAVACVSPCRAWVRLLWPERSRSRPCCWCRSPSLPRSLVDRDKLRRMVSRHPREELRSRLSRSSSSSLSRPRSLRSLPPSWMRSVLSRAKRSPSTRPNLQV